MIHKFATYEEYLEAQIKGSDYRPGRNPEANREEIGEIVRDIIYSVEDHEPTGICHGARLGVERDLFAEAFGGQYEEIIGTDLVPQEHVGMVVWDFNKENKDWLGKFDFVYSNSLDHSPDPLCTLAVWMNQTKPYGRVYLKWTSDHKLESKSLPHRGGDCFGASLEEYIRLANMVGLVVGLIPLPMNIYGRIAVVIAMMRRRTNNGISNA